MKKQLAIALHIIAICFLLTIPIAARATASAPLVFDNPIIAAVGDFVVCADEGGYMTVYTKDGAPIETQPNHNDRLENGYIVSRNCSDGGRMTVFSTAGKQLLTEEYDYIQVQPNDVAFVGIRSALSQGFVGDLGAVDLKTGKIIVPLAYSRICMSADGKKLITNLSDWHHNSWPFTEMDVMVFDLTGRNVTESLLYVSIMQYPNGFYLVMNPKTLLLGVADENGKLLIPAVYHALSDTFGEGVVLVRKGQKWGIAALDGSGTLVQSTAYDVGIDFGNGMYGLRNNADPLSVYYADGTLAFCNPAYSAGIGVPGGVCGDVLVLYRRTDNALVCLSKTGNLLAGPFPSQGYLCYKDFIQLNDGTVINRWGEVVVPAGGEMDGKYLPDGTNIQPDSERLITQYNRGWLVYSGGDDAYVTDLSGNILVPKGTYATLWPFSAGPPNRVANIDDSIMPFPDFIGTDLNGKHVGFYLPEVPFQAAAHDWAKGDLKEAVGKGLVPLAQQRDWRDACTRADFCRLLTPFLDQNKLTAETSVTFSDTTDPDILRVAALGLVSGTGNGKFSPNRPLTRQEAAVILSRCAALLDIRQTDDTSAFADIDDIAMWAQDDVMRIRAIVCGADDQRVMQGVSENRFSPLGYYTREQSIITILRLSRAMQLQAAQLAVSR